MSFKIKGKNTKLIVNILAQNIYNFINKKL